MGAPLVRVIGTDEQRLILYFLGTGLECARDILKAHSCKCEAREILMAALPKLRQPFAPIHWLYCRQLGRPPWRAGSSMAAPHRRACASGQGGADESPRAFATQRAMREPSPGKTLSSLSETP